MCSGKRAKRTIEGTDDPHAPRARAEAQVQQRATQLWLSAKKAAILDIYIIIHGQRRHEWIANASKATPKVTMAIAIAF